MADFPIVKKGYDTEEVDSYIEKLEDVIKSYKEKDFAIKNAIISAQVAADNIVKNAELEAMSRKYRTMEILNAVQADVTKQKAILKSFQADYNSLIKKYLVDFNDVEFLSLFNTLNDLEENIASSSSKLSGKKEEPVARPVEQPAQVAQEPTPIATAPATEAPAETIKVPTVPSADPIEFVSN